jgi:glutathione peroxidase-family protein
VNVVKGDVDPLYKWLGTYSKPKWNFAKYLFNAEGKLIGAYTSDKTPAQLKGEIEKLLA